MITVLRRRAPERPVHVIAHSLGSEIALSALPHLAPHQLNRMVLLTGASFSSRARAMLRTPAGLTTEVLNVTSRENDLFDMAFERMVTPPVPRDTAIGQGIDLPNVTTVQLDCPETLTVLQKLDLPVAPPERRVCHWSTYLRPGAMALYARLLRDSDAVDPRALGRMLPNTTAPRWSRFKRPASAWSAAAAPAVTLPALPLALRLKNRIMAPSSAQGKHNEHAY
ncbi:hypothetical protein ACOTTU_16420 [Roseobacter sp. EG26]|uniref:hypothetical protein n=1 Tax=Roseobacter sp. EG26 TaxID=3412477 RepID=UPI003CE53BEC